MAYRRSLITRASLLSRRRLPHLSPSSSSDDRQPPPLPSTFHTAIKPPLGFTSAHSFMIRNMSSRGDGAGEGEYMADMAEVLSDQVVEGVASVTDQAVAAVTPAVSEVAIAAADSAFPVAALQYLIDGVHSLSGCNWWASIALTTLLIRGATLPLLIDQLKSTSKLSLMRPELEEIKQEMQDKDMDPKAVTEGNQRIQAVFKKYGCTPFTPLKGLLFQGPVFVSFFLAISNMVEKVPSFKEGGAFWFVDLTTPDSLYILPALTALSFWITVECNMQEGMEGNPAAKKMKNLSRVFAVVTVPITMNFPKALFCYWVTSNLFSLTYGLVLKAPGVKKFLNVPEIPVAPPSPTKTSGKPQMSVFESMTKFIAAQKLANTQQSASSAQHATSLPTETSKSAGNQNVPSSAVLSEKLRRLERQVKGKKNNKK